MSGMFSERQCRTSGSKLSGMARLPPNRRSTTTSASGGAGHTISQSCLVPSLLLEPERRVEGFKAATLAGNPCGREPPGRRSAVRISVSAVVMRRMDFCCHAHDSKCWPRTGLILARRQRGVYWRVAAQRNTIIDRSLKSSVIFAALTIRVPDPALLVLEGEALVDTHGHRSLSRDSLFEHDHWAIACRHQVEGPGQQDHMPSAPP